MAHDADQIALAIRWKSFDEARDLLRGVQGVGVKDVLAEAQTIADFLNGTMSVAQIEGDAPTAEGPTQDEVWSSIPHMVTSEGERIPVASQDEVVAAVNLAPGTLPENTVVVERPAKTASRKPKPKKAKSPKKPKAVREPVRDEVGTDTRSEGDPVPVKEDPVPNGDASELPAAA